MLPTCVSHWPISIVYPSGAARATRPTAMLPPAPPTFSMMTGCPSGARMRSAMMRAATSVEPPGGKGTTSVICRDGKGCACALAAMVASASAIMNFLMRSPGVSVEHTAGSVLAPPDATDIDRGDRRPPGEQLVSPRGYSTVVEAAQDAEIHRSLINLGKDFKKQRLATSRSQ